MNTTERHPSSATRANSAALLARREAVVARGVPRGTDLAIASGRGAVVTDLDGNDYLDLSSGIGVTTLGHCDPVVTRAIADQAARLQHVCMHVATYEPYVALCERLAELLPHGDSTRAMLVNSGAEAVENAVKIARQATGRPAVIAYTGAFHGRTLLGMTLTSKVAYKTGCGPFAPGIYRLPFPDALRSPRSGDEFVDYELGRLRRMLVDTVSPTEVAAIVIEPVQGEGGFVPAPAGYLRGLRELCDEHGILLVFDEVQCGFCRTGNWGAYQTLGVVPDLSTWAKALGGGMPIAAVVGRAEVMQGARPGTIGGTFCGNPVSCAAALATLDRMEALRLNQRAGEVGAALREGFGNLARRHEEIVDVRGLGAMIAFELCRDGDPYLPAREETTKLLEAAQRRGVLLLAAGVYANVIRALPPLVITDDELARALALIADATDEVLR